jgi:uncharacterized protein YbgA (DUF1722 family)/uncharacterized protein YbbK (DUF523 family)
VSEKIRVGISSCLLGAPVRFDGGHKHDRYITDTLGQFFDFVPVCPEVECGLGTPRESMHLEGDPAAPRLITSRTRIDVTKQMVRWATRRATELEGEDLCGFIFKANSPSSGMERVRVYNDRGVPAKAGVGVFAGLFIRRFPLLPTEEEGRLHDPALRENFIERVFALRRWRAFLAARPRRAALVAFHTAHKLQLLAHSPRIYRELGKLVAGLTALATAELFERYQQLFMEALRQKTTTRKQLNVLQHLIGYFRREVTADEKRELLEVLDQYARGHLPLIVPVTLLRHYVRKYDQPYLKQQHYLAPHPLELALRNHA